jgi:hypothetical protein
MLAVLATLFLVLSGCVPAVKDVEAPVSGEAVVLGSIKVIEDGKTLKWGFTWEGMQYCRLLILPPGETEARIYQPDNDGNFEWSLPPGDYVIAGYELALAAQFRAGRIWATFTVPPGAKSLYIGDLTVQVGKGLYAYKIEDNHSAASARYREKFPGAADQPQTILLEREPPLGSVEGLSYICAEGWGIECTKKYHGVTPLSPGMSKGSFTETTSLQPRFEWTPSTNSDVTYDLVLFESVSYSRSGVGFQYLPGRVVQYVEGLKEPTWQADAPLAPGHRYFWSVRLRKDGMVSNWSRYSYFAFLIFAWTSGYGQWFSFTTPGK